MSQHLPPENTFTPLTSPTEETPSSIPMDGDGVSLKSPADASVDSNVHQPEIIRFTLEDPYPFLMHESQHLKFPSLVFHIWLIGMAVLEAYWLFQLRAQGWAGFFIALTVGIVSCTLLHTTKELLALRGWRQSGVAQVSFMNLASDKWWWPSQDSSLSRQGLWRVFGFPVLATFALAIAMVAFVPAQYASGVGGGVLMHLWFSSSDMMMLNFLYRHRKDDMHLRLLEDGKVQELTAW